MRNELGMSGWDRGDYESIDALSCAVNCCDTSSISAQGTASSAYTTAATLAAAPTIKNLCFKDEVYSIADTYARNSLDNIGNALRKVAEAAGVMLDSNYNVVSVLKNEFKNAGRRLTRSQLKTI